MLALFSPALARADAIGAPSESDATRSDATQADVTQSYPHISGELVIEIQNDWAYHSQDRDSELNDLYATLGPAIGLAFSESFSIQSSLVLEPVEDPDPHENREFSQHGLFVEELYARLAKGAWSLRAGKLNPRFGQAWDLAPGLYGVDFAEDYELTERIGAGTSYDLGRDSGGMHILSAEIFFADTSHLTRSLMRDRSRVRRSDGGSSNTARLNSYSLTLEGEAILGAPTLTYNLGFAYQLAGEGGQPESDYVAGLSYGIPINDQLELNFLGEFALLDNADGESDRTRRYFTVSSAANFQDLVFALSYTSRDENIRGARDNSDFLAQASVGLFHTVGKGELALEAAYLLTRVENRKTGTAGLRASYVFEF